MASASIAFLFGLLQLSLIVTRTTSLTTVGNQRSRSIDYDVLWYDSTYQGSRTSCHVDISLRSVNCSSRGLKNVPRDIPPNTQYLSLSYNLLQRIRKDSFAGLTSLVDINLKHNIIFDIEGGAFSELHLLKSVNLIGNLLATIPSQLFSRNLHMTDIFLRNNTFTEVPDLYLRAPNLTFIDLGDNSIHSCKFRMNFATECKLMLIDLSDNHIQRVQDGDLNNLNVCSEITVIKFSSNNISSIEPDSLQGLRVHGIYFSENLLFQKGVAEVVEAVVKVPHLAYLNLEKSHLTTLSADIFSPLETTALASISLSRNDISSIPDNVFHHLRSLVTLHLVGNGMTTISPSGFNNLSSLEELYLDSCRIASLKTPAETGVWQPPLKTLSLSNNYLHEIPSKAFLGLEVLHYLILEVNSIRMIHPDSFDGLTSLEVLQMGGNSLMSPISFGAIPTLRSLDLSECGINSLDPMHTFTGLSSLIEVTLSNNYLHVSDIWDKKRNVSLFSVLHKLKYLDLSGNLLSDELPRESFEGLQNLVQLNLQGMSLTRLHPDVFEGLFNLQEISVDDNALKELQPEIFRDQGNLISLYLSRNPISSLDDQIFAHATKLSILSLSGTNVEVITEKILAPVLPSLSTLDLSSKALSCECKNKWLRNWIENISTEVILDDSICSSASPPELEGKPFKEFDPALYCGPRILLYSCISVASVMLIAIMIVLYYNRWWVNYKCFLLKLCIIGYSEIIETTDYDYDINVVFEDGDEEWVKEYLVPNILERDPEITLIDGDDKLPLGMYRLDAVVHVIDNSYKSVFVVSQSAITDSWYLTKLRIALQHVNYAKRDAVLFVFLEDIADEDLPYLIRLLLSANRPYLQWDADPTNQEYFWELFMKSVRVTRKLNYTLPI